MSLPLLESAISLYGLQVEPQEVTPYRRSRLGSPTSCISILLQKHSLSTLTTRAVVDNFVGEHIAINAEEASAGLAFIAARLRDAVLVDGPAVPTWIFGTLSASESIASPII